MTLSNQNGAKGLRLCARGHGLPAPGPSNPGDPRPGGIQRGWSIGQGFALLGFLPERLTRVEHRSPKSFESPKRCGSLPSLVSLQINQKSRTWVYRRGLWFSLPCLESNPIAETARQHSPHVL